MAPCHCFALLVRTFPHAGLLGRQDINARTAQPPQHCRWHILAHVRHDIASATELMLSCDGALEWPGTVFTCLLTYFAERMHQSGQSVQQYHRMGGAVRPETLLWSPSKTDAHT